MDKVMPAILNAFMDTRDNLASFMPLFRAFRLLGEFALSFGKRLLFVSEEARIVDERTVGESRKLLKSNVYADHFPGIGKKVWFDFTGKANIPFAILPADGAGLDLADDRAVKLDLNRTDLGELDFVLRYRPTGLRIGERIVPVTAFEAWIAGILSGFHSAKKRLEGEINTHGDVLKNLGVDTLKLSPRFSEYLKPSGLIVVVKRHTARLVGILSIRKHPVIGMATGFKCPLKGANLNLGRI